MTILWIIVFKFNTCAILKITKHCNISPDFLNLQISKHNIGHDMGIFSKKKSLNKFADLPFDEFKAKYLGLKSNGYPRPARRERIEPLGDLPESLNLTAMGYVTSVKDQGVCGSCWSFATTGLIEGLLFRQSNGG